MSDPEQARLLSDTESARYFDPFVARERNASQAAAEAGCALDTMLYRVKKFLAAGLLRLVRVEKRAGRPVKYYRSSADAYFVPLDATPFSDVKERLEGVFAKRSEEVARALAAMLQEVGWLGTRIYRDASGSVWRDAARDVTSYLEPGSPDFPAVLQTSMDVYLTFDEAKALQLELYRLFRRYQADFSDKGRGRRYGLDIAFLPLEPD